ncbi:hypothetical protein L9F63_026791, partial [Diploptera punctata]
HYNPQSPDPEFLPLVYPVVLCDTSYAAAAFKNKLLNKYSSGTLNLRVRDVIINTALKMKRMFKPTLRTSKYETRGEM